MFYCQRRISCGVLTRRMIEPVTKSSCKMCIIAKAASVGNFAQRLACAQQRHAMQKMGGVIQRNE
jgi:hypothetical protein